MRRFISAAAAALVVAAGFTGLVLAAAPAASAAVSCTGYSTFKGAGGNFMLIPTVGNATGNDNCQLGVGNDSQAVSILQSSLNHCYGAGLTVDGDYGPLTKAAVEHAQSVVGVTVDGIYGPVTRNHIKWYDFSGGCAKL
jgi:Putative peptidoglycan binding domain